MEAGDPARVAHTDKPVHWSLETVIKRRGNLGGSVGSCPPNYNIGWEANVFCPPKKNSQHISSRPNKQTKRYRPTVLHITNRQWCIAKNGGGYTQRGVAKGLKVHCLFMITEVSIRCPKKPGGWYTAYTRVYPPIHHC